MNLLYSLLILTLASFSLFENQLPEKSDDKNPENVVFKEDVPPFSNCPASPLPTTLVQPDNSTITIVGRGNMVNHWTETIDGYTVSLNANGVYEYANKVNGKLVASGVKANDPAQRGPAEQNFISSLQPSLKPALSPLKQSVLSQVQNNLMNKTYPTTGNIRVLALLIDYPDLQNTFPSSNFDSLLYASNYRGGDGSFKYFFETASDSQITVTVDVRGWYRAANNFMYYSRDSGYDRAADLVREAVDAAETAGVNFANYDNDNDLAVDGILAVHAGPGAEQGSRTQYIWSHRWVLNGGNLGSVTYDGVFINDYMINPETRIAGLNQNMVGIGVFCHEFGHNLGLPDLYDTDDSNGDSEGIGNWCLMAGGGWLGGEHRPGNFSAWCKVENNWATPTNLTIGSSNGNYTMDPAVNNRNEIYRVNTNLSNEYFLLENRQKIGLDQEIPGEGLAIWHINTTKTNSFGNRVNGDENLKGVDLEEADGANDLDNEINRGDAGDLFPGSSNNQSFNNSSSPNSQTYQNTNTNLILRNITESGNQVSFDFGPAPVATCSGGTTLTASSSTFDDGSGVGTAYANNLNCNWLIQTTNAPINLSFTRFDVDALGDTLYIYDGANSSATLIGKYTGGVTPANITSTNNNLYLEFITDGFPTSLGWEVSYTSGAPASTCSGTTNLSPALTGSFDDGSGIGSNYANNLDCSWLVNGSSSTLQLSIDSLDIESTNDSIIIYEGQNNQGPIVAIITDNSQATVLTVNSRWAFVEFKTNGSVTAKGWEISWLGRNGCTGADTLRAISGTFSDGTVPAVNYFNNTQCEWLIQPPGASIIKLDFNRFETEQGFDFVEIYDGPTTASPRIARLSGTTLPSTYISSGGSLLVRFLTDFSVTDNGFEATYFSTDKDCLPNRTLNGSSGSFSDGSGPNNYGPGLACGWLIQPNRASSITLSFSAFDTESNNDVVNVYDGIDNTGTLLASFSGSSIPANVVLNGTNVSMFVEFVTNATLSGQGWDASYTSTIASTCSGTTNLTAASGTFDDGSGPSLNYDNNLNCGWLIQPAGNPAVINLDFTFFDIQFGDVVRIYDGTSSGGTLLGTRTGTFSGGTLSAFSGAMFIEFVTNGNLTDPGWTADYSSSSTFCVPTTTFTNNFGAFTDGSPTGLNYLDNSDCSWLIQPTAPNVAIVLNFNRFDTESINDTVTVYDGASTSDPILGTFSGSQNPPNLTSSGGDMLVTFKTNGSVTSGGWRAFYQTQSIPLCAGQTNLTAVSGTFDDGSAANQDYVENSNCSWLLQPSGASIVSLQFNRFVTNSGDTVNVYDGNSRNASLIGSFSGNTVPPLIISSGPSLFVTFNSNGFQNARGWEATYNSSTNQCFGSLTLTNFRDTIEDGSGSANYANNLNCSWLIQPPTANSINLNFTQFDLSDPGDTLKIYDGVNSSASLLAALSGNSIPSTINSSGGDMFIEFITDGSNTAAGWKAFYDINSSLSCVGTTTFTAGSGSFDDGSGSSANYDNNLNCSWLIQPSNNPAVITLTFNSMNTLSFNDRVTVYDGRNNSAQVLGTVFGTNTRTFSAFSGSMYLEFTTNGSGVAAGWDASYQTSNSYCVPNTTLTANFGTLDDGSPFGRNYLNNTSCQWLIQPTSSNVAVRLSFFQFATELGNDTVTIYDGSSTSDPVLGNFSGNSIPPITTSSGNSMLVTFNTNGSGTSQGWRASYNTQVIPACSGLTTLTAASATFDDGSGTASSYVENSNCSWLIQPPGAVSVDLNFNYFNTQPTSDVVRVYDGSNTSGTLLGTFSGSSIPPSLSASSGSMFITFSTDAFNNAIGWEASYTSSTTVNLDAVQDTITVAAALGSQNTFDVTSNTTWNISDNSSWLLTNPVNGSGNQTVSAIAIQPNIGPIRYAEVYLSSTTNNVRDTLIVEQLSSGRFLVAQPDTLFFGANPAGGQSINLQSNVNWNLSSPVGWVNIGTASGNNNGSSQITLNNNAGPLRTSFVVVSGNLGVTNDTVYIVQDSLPPLPPSLSVSPSNVSLAQAANSSGSFVVNSTVSWQTSTPASWLMVQDPQVTMDTNTVGLMTLSMNMSPTDRSTYVAVQDVNGTLFDTVFVSQQGGTLTINASPDTVIINSPQGSTGQITLNSNASWTSRFGNSNPFSLNPSSGSSGNNNITVTANFENFLANSIETFAVFEIPNLLIRDTVHIIQNGIIPFLSPNPRILNLGQAAMSVDSSIVSSNTEWNVDWSNLPAATWLDISGGPTITIPALKTDTVIATARQANPNPSSRSTFIPLIDRSGTVRDTIFITQAGTNPILEANQDTVILASMMGSTANISLLSNGNWTATEGDAWFSSNQNSGSGNGSLTLTSNSANSTANQRISFLALEDASNSLTDTVIVIQDTAQSIVLDADKDTVELGPTAGASASLNLNSNVNWTTQTTDNWYDVSPASGNGNTGITVSANSDNPTLSPRLSYFHFIHNASSGLVDDTVWVRQSANVVNLSVDPSSVILNSNSGSFDVLNISSNTNWTVSNPVSWLFLSATSGTNGASINVIANNDNLSGSDRTATLTFSANGTADVLVTVTQIDGSTPNFTFSRDTLRLGVLQGSSANFSVLANQANWQLSENAPWLLVNPTQGDTTELITVLAATRNAFGNERSVRIIGTANGFDNDTILIIQEASPALFQIAPNQILLPSDSARTASFNISSNLISWTIENDSSWMQVSPDSGGFTQTITVTALETNNFGTIRSGILTINAPPQVPQQITVVQDTVRTIGLQDLSANKGELLIYPNPAKDIVQIQYIGLEEISTSELQLFNAMGKQIPIQAVKKSGQLIELDLSGQAAGLYYLNYRRNDLGISRKLILLD